MTYIDLIGYLAGGLGVISLIPQVIKSFQTRLTRDLSLLRYLVYTTGLGLWVTYGYLIDSYPLLIMNGIAFFLSGTILILKFKHG